MHVRLTERRLPDGFSPEELGQSVSSPDGKFILVSYLTTPLRKGSLNEYVVFVIDDIVADKVDKYAWTISADTGDGFRPILIPDELDIGLFSYRPEKVGNFSISVAVLDDSRSILATLDLQQRVIEVNPALESIIAGDHLAALGGHPATSRELINDLANYIIEGANGLVPEQLLAAIAYQEMLWRPKELPWRPEEPEPKPSYLAVLSPLIRNVELQMAAAKLNDELIQFPGIQQNNPLGVCQIQPQTIAMVLSPSNSDKTYIKWLEKPKDSSKRGAIEIQKNKQYKALDTKCKIDLFNLLRFPKTNLRLCALLLNKLKSREGRWPELTTIDAFLKKEEAIKLTATEYKIGAIDPDEANRNEAKPNAYGEKIYNLLGTPFLSLLHSSGRGVCEVIKVQVLDIRSGKPIKNARVKRLVVTSNGQVIGAKQDFEYNSKPTNPAHGIGLQSQWALKYLGYDPNGPSNNYGDTGRKKYKEYWDDRILSPSEKVEEVKEGNPPDYMLQPIIDEYNSHRATNEDGILEIRIPTNLFDRRTVTVDVGFWEFPIVTEALANDATGLCRSKGHDGKPKAEPTKFEITWKGDQSPDFEDNVKNSHFGWEVKNKTQTAKLKVAVRLNLKDDKSAFSGIPINKLSTYFSKTGKHFTLFGMQWCQPIFDEIIDPPVSFRTGYFEPEVSESESSLGDIKSPVFVTRKDTAGKWVRDVHMHIVTQYNGSSLYYGYYNHHPILRTKYRQKRAKVNGSSVYNSDGSPKLVPRQHDGIDLYSGPEGNALCYAMHGGKFYSSISGTKRNKGYGKLVRIKFKDRLGFSSPGLEIRYAHLSDFENLVNQVVLAGQIIGKSGRTDSRSTEYDDETPGHLHLELRKNSKSQDPQTYLSELAKITPETDTTATAIANSVCLPSNKLPVMLPCKCKYKTVSIRNCSFKNKDIAKECWTIKKYPDYDGASSRNPTDKNQTEFPEKTITSSGIRYFVCPYVFRGSLSKLSLEKEEAKLKIQARLRFIYINQKKLGLEGLFDPGNINGKIRDPLNSSTKLPSISTDEWNIGDEVSVKVSESVEVSEYDGQLLKVERGSIIGWLGADTLDESKKLKYPIKAILREDIFNQDPASDEEEQTEEEQIREVKTNMAIYRFRLATNKLKYGTEYVSNFRVDKELAELIDELSMPL
jgi:murein DD-endopeptidase MepM/ murein hydrolase activator NlpD